MKFKKSTPMYIALMMLICLAFALTIDRLIKVFSINTYNPITYSAIKDSIILNNLILIFLIYKQYELILSFNKYSIKQEIKNKVKKDLNNLLDTFKNKVKEFVNDNHHKSNQNINKENKEIIEHVFDFSKSNDDFVKKSSLFKGILDFSDVKDYYDYLNKEYNHNSLQLNVIDWEILYTKCRPKRMNNEKLSDFNNRLEEWKNNIPGSIKDYVIKNNSITHGSSTIV